MPHHVYKHIDLTGSSSISSDDAIKSAVKRASETIRGMRWFKVLETRGQIEGGQVQYWQVTIQVGFTIED